MTKLLKVYLNENHVGNLWLENKNYCFQYISIKTHPISLSLPVCGRPYLNDEAKPYFANLLPEGDTRTLIEARLGTPRGDDFALLSLIGGDCAGAITLFPEDQTPFVDAAYKELSNDELITLVKELPKNPLSIPVRNNVKALWVLYSIATNNVFADCRWLVLSDFLMKAQGK